MKTYKEFIIERNKFEKFLLKKGIKSIDKLVRKNPKAFERVKDDMSNQIKNLRFDPDYRFTSLRRGAENVANRFRDMIAPSGMNPNNLANPTKLRQKITRGANKKSWLGRYKLPNPTKKRISSEGLTKTVVSRDIGGHQEYYSTWLRDMINRNVSTVVVVIDHRHLLDDNNLDNQTALGYLVESLATKRRPKGLSFRGWLRARKYAPQRLILVANKADEWLSDDTFPMWEKGLIARHPIFDVFRNHLYKLQAMHIPVYIDAMSARYAWNVQDSIIKGMKI